MPVISPPHASLLWRVALLTASIVLSCSSGSSAPPQDSRNQALDDFQNRLFDYLAVRFEATRHLPSIRTRSSFVDVYRARRQHVQAVRDAREDARAGDVFGPDAASIIRTTIAETLREHDIDVAALLAEQRVDAPRGGYQPVVNDDFPRTRGAAVPYVLIVALPRLPRPLQYRFCDRDLLLLDLDLGLIVDILPDALPEEEPGDKIVPVRVQQFRRD